MKEDNFYSFTIKKPEKGVWYVLILASLVVLVILYPMWPYPVKLGIFYIVFALLVFLISVNIVRLFAWLLFWIGGMSFWIFPRLYDDNAGFFGSWVPIYSFSLNKGDGVGMWVFRIMTAILVALSIAHYVQVFSFEELESIYKDTFDWTKDKIVGNDTYALTIKGGHGKYGSIDDILKMTEE